MNKQTLVFLVGVIMLSSCSKAAPDLGVNNGRLMACPKTPNCVSSQAADEKHYIEPFHFTGTQQEAQDRLLQILKAEPRTKIVVIQNNYIRVEFTSAIFRFVDDGEFYFPETQGDQMIIHVRSASRVGRSDLGANQKRIEQIRSKFSGENK